MKVLMVHRPGGAFGYITDGLINAFRDRGHTIMRWDGLEDSWNSFDPVLYIGCSSHKQPIPPRSSKCKIAIHVNPHGPVDLGGLNENEVNRRWTLAQNPDAVFGYGHADDEIYWSYWKTEHGIQWVPMPTAGDKTIFKILDVEKKFDIVYLGGHWAYKGRTIDTYLLPILKNNKYSNRVYGWGDWPSGICSGVLSDDRACEFLNSGLIGPCISEQHTHQYGIDVPERAFKVALCGVLVIHDATVSLRRMIPSAVIASGPDQFASMCDHFINHPQERETLALQQRDEVFAGQTYHHRISNLLDKLGFVAEAAHMLE